MKYSEKYNVTETIISDGVTYTCSLPVSSLYAVNEDFDNSIIYTSSEFIDDLKIYKNPRNLATTEFFSNNSIKEQEATNCKLGVCFVIANTNGNQWGYGTRTNIIGGGNPIRFVKNMDVQNFIFKFNITIGNQTYTVDTLQEVLNEWYQSGASFSIQRYMWTGTEWKTSPVEIAFVVYENDIAIGVYTFRDLFVLNQIDFIYNTNFSRFYKTYNTKIVNFVNSPTKAYFLASNFPKDGDAILYGTEQITEPIIYENEFFQLRESKTDSTNNTITTFFSVDYINKILASMGAYFTNIDLTNSENKFKNFRQLLLNGNIWLGEMKSGRTTGKWLHQFEKILTAENYNITTENEKYSPSGDEKDTIENMIDNVIYNYSSSPFTKYYKVGIEHIKALSDAITTNEPPIPDGLNVFDNIVGLTVFPFDVSTYCRFPVSDTIKIYNWDSEIGALRIDTQTTNQTLCTVNISKIYGDFRDYSPYTKRSIFLPLYGNYELPDIVVGRTLKITQNSDIVNNSFSYIISVGDDTNQCVIDKIKVKCGSECDFIAINKSIKNISVLQNQLSTANSIISGISSIAGGNAYGIASSITGIAQSVINTDISKNTSYTTHTSQNDSISDLLDVKSIYLTTVKSTYLPFNPKVNGYVYNKTDLLSNHTGFCKCENVNININCTFNEQTEIKNLLENGVYI